MIEAIIEWLKSLPTGLNEVMFWLIQFLQITFIPIPSTPVTALGALMFPFWKCFVLTVTAHVSGSLLAFWMARKFGLGLIYKLGGRDSVERMREKMKGREKTIGILGLIFPVFPDDLISLLLGLTNMRYSTFLFWQVLCRSMTCAWTFYGTQALALIGQMQIPFYYWLIGGGIAGALITAMIIYQDKITDFFIRVATRIKELFIINKIKRKYKNEFYKKTL